MVPGHPRQADQDRGPRWPARDRCRVAVHPERVRFRRDGSLLVGDALQRQIHRWDGKALQPLANLADVAVFCLSDGIVDAHDRMYVGDIGYNFFDPANKPVDTCVIACVDAEPWGTG